MKDTGIQLADSENTANGFQLKIEPVRDSNNLITVGLVVGNTLNQNQALILVSNPGEFRFNPTIGVALDGLLLDEDYLKFRHRIREHLAKDGIKVKTLELRKGTPLKIDSSYE